MRHLKKISCLWNYTKRLNQTLATPNAFSSLDFKMWNRKKPMQTINTRTIHFLVANLCFAITLFTLRWDEIGSRKSITFSSKQIVKQFKLLQFMCQILSIYSMGNHMLLTIKHCNLSNYCRQLLRGSYWTSFGTGRSQ